MTAVPPGPIEPRRPDDPRITHSEAAGTTDTTTDQLVPPTAVPFEGELDVDPQGEVDRLEQYLVERFPGELDLSNRQTPEAVVDVAMRLLSGLSVQGTGIERCGEQYCNKPENHGGVHGWVHFQ